MTNQVPENGNMTGREDNLSGLVRLFDRFAVVIAGIALLGMMLMTLLDVLGLSLIHI